MTVNLISDLAKAKQALCDPEYDIAIYGSGGIGRHIHFSLSRYTDRIMAFADANERFASMRLFGLPIVLPQALQSPKKLLILIGIWDRGARKQILENLNNMGINGEAIDFSGFTLNQALAGPRSQCLGSTRVTLISNSEKADCFAESLGDPELCFTSGLRMAPEAFLALCRNFREILHQPMHFMEKDGTITGHSGSIAIDFLAWNNLADARAAWARKLVRVQPDNIFILVDDQFFAFAERELAGLAEIKARGLAVLTNQLLLNEVFQYAGSPRPTGVPAQGTVQMIFRQYFHQDYISLGQQAFETVEHDYFDLIEWFRTGEIHLAEYPENIV